MIETAYEHCKHKDCIYYSKRVPMHSTWHTCDYCYRTGHPRGCEISKCDKYIPSKKNEKSVDKNE